MIPVRLSMSSPATASILAVWLLHQLLLSHPTSAFLTPVNVRAISARSITSSGGISSSAWKRRCSAGDTSAAQGEPEAVAETLEEGDTEGMVRSPAGLTLEGVYKRLKLEVQGLDDGIVGLDSRDTDYGVSEKALYCSPRYIMVIRHTCALCLGHSRRVCYLQRYNH